MPLTNNRELEFFATQELIDVPVADDVVIYKGAFVGLDRETGLARPLIAGDLFIGVAYRKTDNTVAGHTAGGIRVRLHQSIDINHPIPDMDRLSTGCLVFAHSDYELSLNQVQDSYVGRLVGIPGKGVGRVRLQPWGLVQL